jgi:TonB family protein
MKDFRMLGKEARGWVLAACASLALHAAFVALVVFHLRSNVDEAALGAPAIEVELVLAAPHTEPTDLPPGPNVEGSAAAPAAQKKNVEPSELAKVVPTETDDPDGLTAADKARPKKDDPDVAPANAAPADPSVAAVATAIPRPETAEDSARSVTPAEGTGESAMRVRATWEKELAAHFDKYKRYPTDRSHQAAELTVTFELDRAGHILSTHIVQGSGDASFDEAGLAMMRRADPVPVPPAPVADEGLTFTMPIMFRFKGRS